jgi:hypothetical protein
VADLRSRFIEDYAGGLLNIARQEISSTGEVLAQDGFVDSLTLFVEDGRGVKSGLRLGSALAECVDPTTETGLLNVRTADRTYAKIRDLKIFSTAVASAQAALSEAVSESLTNLEGAFESLENDVQVYRARGNESIDGVNQSISSLSDRVAEQESTSATISQDVDTLSVRISTIETTLSQVDIVKQERVASIVGPILDDGSTSDLEMDASRYYAILNVTTDVPAWVTFYTSSEARNNDNRLNEETEGVGVVADVVTDVGSLSKSFAPAVIGYGSTRSINLRIRNLSGLTSRVGVQLRYISL